MKVVLFNLNQPEVKVVVAEAQDEVDAKRIMALFRKGNAGWQVNRRPNLDTWDNVALTFVKD